MTYHIGQIVPIASKRGIVHGPEIKPVWHALMVAPKKEKAACEILKHRDIYAFYPKNDVTYNRRGRRIVRKFPIIPRIVYARFSRSPQWDVMRRDRIITGVFCLDSRPIEIPRQIIRRIQGLPNEARQLLETREDLFRIRVGDRARITNGPFEGFFVDVTEVEAGQVWFQMITKIGMVKGEIDCEDLERALPDDEKSSTLSAPAPRAHIRGDDG